MKNFTGVTAGVFLTNQDPSIIDREETILKFQTYKDITSGPLYRPDAIFMSDRRVYMRQVRIISVTVSVKIL